MLHEGGPSCNFEPLASLTYSETSSVDYVTLYICLLNFKSFINPLKKKNLIFLKFILNRFNLFFFFFWDRKLKPVQSSSTPKILLQQDILGSIGKKVEWWL